KLAFQPVLLKDFLSGLADVSNTVNRLAVNEFFTLNPQLDGSLVSFGYFVHFPQESIISPFDLMARFLFKGSATTLNGRHPGIDLMIPLVLNDGRISFVGVQVKFTSKGEYVSSVLSRALEKLYFSDMFPKQQNDRPFGLIILIHGDYNNFGVSTRKIKERVRFNEDGHSTIEQGPSVIVFKGIHNRFKSIFNATAPANCSYRGIADKFLAKCDHIYDLIQESPESKKDVPQNQGLSEGNGNF